MISKILTQTLRNIADQLDAGNCNLQEEEMLKIMEFISECNTERPMSKEQACNFFFLFRSQFDTYVRQHIIPKGKKILGFKELSWTKSDLTLVKEKLKQI